MTVGELLGTIGTIMIAVGAGLVVWAILIR